MFKQIFKGVPWWITLISFTFTLVWSAFNVGYITKLGQLTATILEADGPNREELLPKLILGYVLYLLLWEVIEYIADLLGFLTATRIENHTLDDTMKQIYTLKPSVIKKYNTGYLNGVTSKYMYQKEAVYSRLVLFFPLSVIYVVYAVIKMGGYNIWYGISLLILLTIGTLLKVWIRHHTQELENTLTECESIRNKRVIDSVHNIGTIQKMKSLDFMVEKLSVELKKCVTATLKLAVRSEVELSGFKGLVYMYLPVACLIYYILGDNSRAAEMFSFLAVISVQMVHVGKDTAATINELNKFKANYNKINEILSEDNKRVGVITGEEFSSAEIEDTEYSYFNQDKKVTTTVIIPKFKLNKGDKVCIYGESGQGKTTLLNILSGEIETENVKVNDKKVKERLDCVFISQDTEMLDMTLRENLTLGNKDIKDEDIIELLYKCGLQEWFDRQSDGLDTPLGERGVFVSTGQRQRLNLIRGLLIRDKEIYLLDEPTSNVDEKTEEDMIEAIQKYIGDKTLVIVTHRPKIKNICNKAYKFENSILGQEENY